MSGGGSSSQGASLSRAGRSVSTCSRWNRPAKATTARIVGAEDRWVMTPGNTVMRVAGSGDFWWAESRVTYPNDEVYMAVTLMELRDGLVYHETTYWAAPFEAPTWRAPWVDRPG